MSIEDRILGSSYSNDQHTEKEESLPDSEKRMSHPHKPAYDDPVIDMGRICRPDDYRRITGKEPRRKVDW